MGEVSKRSISFPILSALFDSFSLIEIKNFVTEPLRRKKFKTQILRAFTDVNNVVRF